jgi:hypothetical protein
MTPEDDWKVERQEQRAEQTERRERQWRQDKRTPIVAVVGVIMLSLIMTGFAVVSYTAYAQARSDHRWCDLLNGIDQPNVPATTERARNAQRQIHKLRIDFGCTDK